MKALISTPLLLLLLLLIPLVHYSKGTFVMPGSINKRDAMDTTPPVVYCLTGIITVPMPNAGCITIFAKDLDRGSVDDITQVENLRFYFNGDSSKQSVTICCDDFIQSLASDELKVELQMWVKDEAGNEAYCNATLIVEDNQNVCPDVDPQGSVTGSVKNRKGNLVTATISLYKDNNISEEVEGSSFKFNPFPGRFNICARRDDQHTNGVSTADIVKIQRHILGLEPLTHPYLLLAADVNVSSSITASDVSEIRKLILGLNSRFSKVPSWVFIPLDTNFTNPFPTAKFFNSYCKTFDLGMNDLLKIDFNAIKMGDVTENAIGGNLNKNQTRNQHFILNYKNQELNNDLINTEFNLEQNIELTGIQFTLSFNATEYEFLRIENGNLQLNEDQYSIHEIDKGKLHIVWDRNPFENTSSSSGTLFSIIWKRKTVSDTDMKLNFDPDGVQALIIDQDLNEMNLTLQRSTQNPIPDFTIYNDVNNHSIHIEGLLHQSSIGTYSITDLTGRVVIKRSIELNEGLFHENISTDAIPANNLYLIKFDTGQHSKTIKYFKFD